MRDGMARAGMVAAVRTAVRRAGGRAAQGRAMEEEASHWCEAGRPPLPGLGLGGQGARWKFGTGWMSGADVAAAIEAAGEVLGRADAATSIVAFADHVASVRATAEGVEVRPVARFSPGLVGIGLEGLAALSGDEWMSEARAVELGVDDPGGVQATLRERLGTAMGLTAARRATTLLVVRARDAGERHVVRATPEDAGVRTIVAVARHAAGVAGPGARWVRGTGHPRLRSSWTAEAWQEELVTGRIASTAVGMASHARGRAGTLAWLGETGADEALVAAVEDWSSWGVS